MKSTVSPSAWWRAIDQVTQILAVLAVLTVAVAGLRAPAQTTPADRGSGSGSGSGPAAPASASASASGSASTTATIGETYRIQPTDILIIDVVNEPKLTGKEFRVSASGEVSYPYVGAVKAGGRTPIEIQVEIKRLLELDYLVNAEVLVQVKEFRKRLVQVLGQVTRPGLVEIPAERRLSMNEAITMAGGYTRLARTSDIQLTRIGRPEPMRFTAEELRNPDKAVYLEQGDVIYVPESRI